MDLRCHRLGRQRACCELSSDALHQGSDVHVEQKVVLWDLMRWSPLPCLTPHTPSHAAERYEEDAYMEVVDDYLYHSAHMDRAYVFLNMLQGTVVFLGVCAGLVMVSARGR